MASDSPSPASSYALFISPLNPRAGFAMYHHSYIDQVLAAVNIRYRSQTPTCSANVDESGSFLWKGVDGEVGGR